jgi:hypothetical protein
MNYVATLKEEEVGRKIKKEWDEANKQCHRGNECYGTVHHEFHRRTLDSAAAHKPSKHPAFHHMSTHHAFCYRNHAFCPTNAQLPNVLTFTLTAETTVRTLIVRLEIVKRLRG